MSVTLVGRYDPLWPTRFEQIRQVLQTHLADIDVRIEHVGSTAIPSMIAKPIIDLIIIVPQGGFGKACDKLQEIGYAHQGALGIVGREAFDLRDETLAQALGAHHLYVCETDSAELQRQIAFRDFLRSHPDEALALSQLKWRLAEEYDNDRQAYMAGKSALVQEITCRALASRSATVPPPDRNERL